MTATQYDLQPVAAQMETKPDAFMVLVEKIQHLPPEAMGKVLDNYERFLAIQAKQAYDVALFELKRHIPPILKTKLAKIESQKGNYSYRYPDLDKDVCDKLDPVLDAHGFGYRWKTRPSDQGVVMVCVLYHIQGHQEETDMPPAPADNSGGKNACQAVGSTLSYMQRYSLLMALGIAPKNVDDDGRASAGPRMDLNELLERIEHFPKCETMTELEAHFRSSHAAAKKIKDQSAIDAIIAAKDKRKMELRKAGAL